MWHFYKVPNSTGYQLEGHPQAMDILAEHEITEEQYEAEIEAIKTRSAVVRGYTEQVNNGEITIDDVPEEYQEEVQRNVDAAAVQSYTDQVVAGAIAVDDVPEKYREEVREAAENNHEIKTISTLLQEVSEVDY